MIFGDATIELTEDSTILHASKHHLSWHKRKQVYHVLKEAVGERHLKNIKRSTDQGRAFDSVSLHPDSSFFTYTGSFLSYQYRFIHKARLNLLPVRTVQARCPKQVPSTQCRLCGRVPETLAHMVNHCHYNLGLIRERHNAILDRIVRAVPTFMAKLKVEKYEPLRQTLLLRSRSCPSLWELWGAGTLPTTGCCPSCALAASTPP